MTKKYKKKISESSEESSDYDDVDDNDSIDEYDSDDNDSENSSEEEEEKSPPKKSRRRQSDRATDVTEEDEIKGTKKKKMTEEEHLVLDQKIRAKLKKKILSWLDDDDKIKEMNLAVKQMKDNKKAQEVGIIDMMNKLGMGDRKIDVHGNDSELKGRVYRHKSVTKGAIKEDIIKDALMETIRDEKKVNQLVKKIENKRPINERYYLKRTKGNRD